MAVLGIRHAALAVRELPRAITFYRDELGFAEYAVGDGDWAMLSRGSTSLSLVLAPKAAQVTTDGSHPAHLGVVLESRRDVDELHAKLSKKSAGKVAAPKRHRDDSYGFYLHDPDGNQLEVIFIPLVQDKSPEEALILFAHGSSDPAWRKPIEAYANLVREHFPKRRVEIAYMEFCEPTLKQVAKSLVVAGVRKARLVPLFFSAGAHVAQDVPKQAAEVTELQLVVTAPVGSSAFFRQGMLEALGELL